MLSPLLIERMRMGGDVAVSMSMWCDVSRTMLLLVL